MGSVSCRCVCAAFVPYPFAAFSNTGPYPFAAIAAFADFTFSERRYALRAAGTR